MATRNFEGICEVCNRDIAGITYLTDYSFGTKRYNFDTGKYETLGPTIRICSSDYNIMMRIRRDYKQQRGVNATPEILIEMVKKYRAENPFESDSAVGF